jgi:hypothetical protein
MPFELAKELKEAGWPQPHEDTPIKGAFISQYPRGYAQFELIYSPILSELIEACGEGFETLEREPYEEDGQLMYVHFVANNKRELMGRTPEEAVARLWLALNVKKV